MFSVWSLLYQTTYNNGYLECYQLNFICYVGIPELLNHKVFYFS